MRIHRTGPLWLLTTCALAVVACNAAPGSAGDTAATAGNSSSSGFVPGTHVHKMPKLNTQHQELALTAPSGAHLTYYGGHVISNVQVVQVLWGAGTYLPQVMSTASPSMASFYAGVTNSPYFDWLSEYDTTPAVVGQSGTDQTIGRGTFLRQVQIAPSAANSGSTVDDTNIQAELAAQIQAGTLPAPTTDAAGNTNTIYMVNFPAGVTITQQSSTSCVDFCAYHGTFTLNGKSEYYGVLPDMSSGSACAGGCGSDPAAFNNQTSVASHELVEAVTDAEVGLATVLGAPLAWYDQTNGEIGDICNAEQGTVVGGDGVSYVVQAEFSNTDNACIVQHATTVSDFSLSASSSSVALVQNTSGTVTIRTAVTSGSAQAVSLSISGLPSGATASFNPASVTAGGSSTLTINAGTAAPGTYTLTVTGASSTATHMASISLSVTAPVVNDFSISASPTSLALAQSASGSVSISTQVSSGSTQSITLSVSGLPSGATASFNASTINAGSTATLTINAGSAAVGSYTVTVTATGTSRTHTATVSLTITSAPVYDFTLSLNPTALSLAQGAQGSVTVATAVSSGSAQAVTLSVSGVPAGTTASFNTTSITAGGTATLTVSAGTAAAGSYSITVTGSSGGQTHSATLALTVTAPSSGGTSITNGGFETGTLSGWTASGVSSVITSAHSGSYAAQLGSSNPSTDSSIVQTFTLPSNATTLTVWYKVTCPDTVQYDWSTASLKDNSTGTVTTVLAKTCTNTGTWASAQVSVSSSAGHSVTLTLSNHDDNYAGDATYTAYDDVTIGTGTTTPPPPPPPSTGGVTNGGFETSSLSGWTPSGASATATSTAHHSGSYAALLGSTAPTNGDSSIKQTFTAPSGTSKLSFWYLNTCPDNVQYDWATATLKDNNTGKTTTVLAKTCTPSGTWTSVTAAIVAGHSYTLTLTNHDDNYAGDATFTTYDDVTLQ